MPVFPCFCPESSLFLYSCVRHRCKHCFKSSKRTLSVSLIPSSVRPPHSNSPLFGYSPLTFLISKGLLQSCPHLVFRSFSYFQSLSGLFIPLIPKILKCQFSLFSSIHNNSAVSASSPNLNKKIHLNNHKTKGHP